MSIRKKSKGKSRSKSNKKKKSPMVRSNRKKIVEEEKQKIQRYIGFTEFYNCPEIPFLDRLPSDSLLLEENDLHPFNGEYNPSLLNYQVNDKLKKAYSFLQSKGKLNHNISIDGYKQLYFTSDIRSDFLKLVQVLVLSKLIELPDNISISDLYNKCGTERIFRYVACYSKWIAEDTLFVILGNLVNGARFGYEIQGDYEGSFELLIHVLLYNLRLQALEKNSFVVFTIGNHDFHTVIVNDGMFTKENYNFVTRASNSFFDGIDRRANALLPFYDLSPYFVLLFTLRQVVRVIGVNAGLHYKDTNNLIQTYPTEWIDEQKKYTKMRLSQDDSRTTKGIISKIIEYSKGERSPIWTSFYAKEHPDEVCNSIQSIKSHPIVVVGNHWTARDSPMLTHLKSGTNSKILKGCDNHLVFVNTGMSSLFGPGRDRMVYEGRLSELGGNYETHYCFSYDGCREVEILKISGDRFDVLDSISIPSQADKDDFYSRLSESRKGWHKQQKNVHPAHRAIGGE
jgi:hypothetical protein